MREGWEYKRFNEVFDLQMGKTPSRDDPRYWGGNNIWVSIADLQGKYIGSSKEGISDTAVSESGIKIVPKDTVIMSFKLSVGRSAITTTDLYTNEAIMSFSPKPEYIIIPDYIYYYLKGYKWVGANKAVMGMTLNKKSISSNIFAIPEFKVQQQIVSELDLLSGSIEKQKAQLEELDKLSQSIFYDMFGDPVLNDKGWEIKLLKDISEIGTGSTPNRNFPDYYDSGTISWVKTTEVQNCDIFDTEEKITELAIKETNCKVYPIGTLLIAMYGQGKTRGQLAKLRIPAATNQACAAIQIKESFCCLEYLYSCLFLLYDDIRSMAQGGNQANLNLKLVSSIRIILPPLALQQEFAAKVEQIESMKAKVRQSLTEAETLFNSRMDYYFN